MNAFLTDRWLPDFHDRSESCGALIYNKWKPAGNKRQTLADGWLTGGNRPVVSDVTRQAVFRLPSFKYPNLNDQKKT